MLFSSPLHLVCPIRCAHLALGNVLGMAGFKGLLAGGGLSIPRHALLSETNGFNLTARLGYHHM